MVIAAVPIIIIEITIIIGSSHHINKNRTGSSGHIRYISGICKKLIDEVLNR
jgi:hypothetical protein